MNAPGILLSCKEDYVMEDSEYKTPYDELCDAEIAYKSAIFGLMTPTDITVSRFRTAEENYKKALKKIIKDLRSELKAIESSRFVNISTSSTDNIIDFPRGGHYEYD